MSAKKIAKNKPQKINSWNRLDVNIQLPQSKIDALKSLAKVSKFGWSNYVAFALCNYASTVKDRMNGGTRETVVIDIEPELVKQLRLFGDNNFSAAKGRLNLVARAVLRIAMMNRPFIQKEAGRFVRYAKAEGFDDQELLIKARLEAVKD